MENKKKVIYKRYYQQYLINKSKFYKINFIGEYIEIEYLYKNDFIEKYSLEIEMMENLLQDLNRKNISEIENLYYKII